MQSNLMTLLRNDFLKQFGINALKYEKDKKRKNRAVGMALLYVFLGAMLVGYSLLLSLGFGFMGMSDIVPGFALTITGIITLFFTFFKTNGVLFASHDYNMLMSLPIKIETIITAKFLSMYLSNLLFTVLVMAPMGIGYAVWGHITVINSIMWFIVYHLVLLVSRICPVHLRCHFRLKVKIYG